MKKITILLSLALVGTAAMAQQIDRVPKLELPGRHIELPVDANRLNSVVALKHQEKAANQQQTAATSATIGYRHPLGTFFLGMDQYGGGTYVGESAKTGVVGAWSYKIPAWVWPQTIQADYKTLSYTTYFKKQNPSFVEENYYSQDSRGNFIDSLSAGGSLESYMGSAPNSGYSWFYGCPLQKVGLTDNSIQYFQLLSTANAKDPQNDAYTIGGIPTSWTNGLYPLTNAQPKSQYGFSAELYAANDLAGGKHFYYGTDMHVTAVDSVSIPEEYDTYEKTSTVIRIDTITHVDSTYNKTWQRWDYKYTTVYDTTFAMDTIHHTERIIYSVTGSNPTSIITRYEAPQMPLYVQSISLWLGAEKADSIRVGNLTVTVRTTDGEEVATSSVAQLSDMRSSAYSATGKMLTFSFNEQDAYGTTLKDGFVVSKAFEVEISGLDANSNFGIYSAKSVAHSGKSCVAYENGDTVRNDFDPYITLTGIMNTLEDYYQAKGYKTGDLTDTIYINFNSTTSNYYKYYATYADGDVKGGNEFLLFSSYVPYDTASLVWNMEVERPRYVLLSPDATYCLNPDAEDPSEYLIFNYYRAFFLYIYATETPKVNDVIRLTKYGRTITYIVRAVDGVTALDDVEATDKPVKFFENGKLYIRRGEKIFDAAGVRVK